MPAHLNDRQIVEQMVLPAILTAIILVMRGELNPDDDGSQELDRAHTLLSKSLLEPTINLPQDRISKLARRSKRVIAETVMPLFDKHSLGTQYLTVAYLISELAEEDIIRIGAESPFAEAWDIMSQVMDSVVDQLPEMDKIATLEARNLRTRFAELGYFA